MTERPVVGILHPGAMGAAVGAAARAGAARVLWARQGRSDATRLRADRAGLEAVDTVAELVRASDVIIAVCPPHAARPVAEEVAAHGLRGAYLDANAVAPATVTAIADVVGADRLVDGGIIGPPAWHAGTTVLHLSGGRAEELAEVFDGSPLATSVVSAQVGAASALKAGFAAWTKAGAALALAARSLAASAGVEDALLAEWRRASPDALAACEGMVRHGAPKAWRWESEMREAANAFAAADLPDGFSTAAADVFARLAGFRDVAAPEVASVIAAMGDPPGAGTASHASRQ